MNPATVVKRACTAALGYPPVNRAVRLLAGARGHRLVLVYHRLGASAPPGCEVIPTVPVDVFRRQLAALGEVVDLVSLDDVVAGGTGSRPMVALTFDDDLPSHATDALPQLGALGVPAAFFLSGRALHGLGPYWFQQLEALLASHGPDRTAELLAVGARQSEALARACERDADARRRIGDLARDLPEPAVLRPEDITALAVGGMTVGFHTLDHGTLPDMDDVALRDAVARGRDRLGAAVGSSPRHFAYPHGKADARVATAVRGAGFAAAWTGRPVPVRDGADPYLLGRWEPGPLGVDALLVKLAVRLLRSAPSIPQAAL